MKIWLKKEKVTLTSDPYDIMERYELLPSQEKLKMKVFDRVLHSYEMEGIIPRHFDTSREAYGFMAAKSKSCEPMMKLRSQRPRITNEFLYDRFTLCVIGKSICYGAFYYQGIAARENGTGWYVDARKELTPSSDEAMLFTSSSEAYQFVRGIKGLK